MASAVTHGFVGVLFAQIVPPKKRTAFFLLSAACACLPDIDVLGAFLGFDPSGMWYHRGITHSLLFAFLTGVVVSCLWFGAVRRLSRDWWSLVLYFFSVTASHGVIDAFTKSPRGVAFFAPFSAARYLFPFRPIPGVGLARFFTSTGEAVFLTEVCLLWLPGMAVALLTHLLKHRSARGYELT